MAEGSEPTSARLSPFDARIPGEPLKPLIFPCDVEYWPIPQVGTDGAPFRHSVKYPRGTHDVPLRHLADGIIERHIQQGYRDLIQKGWRWDGDELVPPLPVPPPVVSVGTGPATGTVFLKDVMRAAAAPQPEPDDGYVDAQVTYEKDEEPATPPLERVVTVGEFIGWRVWRVKRGYLQSYAQDTFWAPGEPMTARNIGDTGMVGVWAFKERRRALDKLLEEARYSIMAYGAVALWGTVVEHELGYRGEFAKIISIDELTGKERGSFATRREQYKLRRQRLFQLRRRYGVRGFEVSGFNSR